MQQHVLGSGTLSSSVHELHQWWMCGWELQGMLMYSCCRITAAVRHSRKGLAVRTVLLDTPGQGTIIREDASMQAYPAQPEQLGRKGRGRCESVLHTHLATLNPPVWQPAPLLWAGSCQKHGHTDPSPTLTFRGQVPEVEFPVQTDCIRACRIGLVIFPPLIITNNLPQISNYTLQFERR